MAKYTGLWTLSGASLLIFGILSGRNTAVKVRDAQVYREQGVYLLLSHTQINSQGL